MPRSLKKGPFVSHSLLNKINKAVESNSKKSISTYSRTSVIIPLMVGFNILVHNGRQMVPVHITEVMVGHKLGEYSQTRTFKMHSGDRKTK
jgi:small subunit ribosomal protein S19|tara:strand:+ start:2967 stop:3239 length:273 start_codon:yes stop_codon:yes gene_type:complete